MKKLSLLLVLSMTLSLFAGCSSETVQNSKSNERVITEGQETVAPQKSYKLSLAAQNNSGQVFQYLADSRGYLKDENLTVEMQYINNGTDAFTALAGGKVDILSTYGTGGPLIQIANGQPFTIFGGYMITGETPCFGKPETKWDGLKDFEGKTIAITRGGTPDIVMKSILWKAGLYDKDETKTKVHFIEMKTNQDTLQAVTKGEADFRCTATGYELQAAALGLEIKMWPDDYYENHSCCRMLCSNKFIEDADNQEALYHLFRAYLRAESDMQDKKVLSEVVDLVVKILDLDKPTVESFIYSPHMKYNTDPNKHAVQKMWNNMAGFGYLPDTTIKLEDHFENKIYEKALNSLIADFPNNQFFKDKLERYHLDNDGDYNPDTDENKIITDLNVNLMKK